MAQELSPAVAPLFQSFFDKLLDVVRYRLPQPFIVKALEGLSE